MAQVQNLLDLFQKGRDTQAADAKPAPRAASPAKAPGKGGSGDLLPVAPAKGNRDVSPSPSSFQAKVEKSKAKLAARDHAPKAPDAASRRTNPAAPAAKPAEAPSTAQSASRGDAARPQTAARNARPGRPEARTQPRADRAQENANPESSRAPAAGETASAPTERGEQEQPQGLDEKTLARIKQGLEDLGVQVDDEQLNDPAFLMDILRVLQSMPMQALPQAEAQPAEAPAVEAVAAAGTAEVQPQGQAAPQVPQQAAAEAPAEPLAPEAKPQGETPKPVSRKELARLLENRAAGLERAAQSPTGHAQAPAQAPGAVPKEWTGAPARLPSEGPSPDPLPMADLDRLRVMQASAMQAAPAKAEAGTVQTDLVLESDSIEPASEPAHLSQAEGGRDASSAQDQAPQGDLLGRDGDQAAGAGNLPSQSGAQAAKEAAGGPQFHHVLEQARSVDHRAGLPAGAEPRAAVHDAAVLDQIAKRMGAITRKSGDEISIQLSPEHLGKVRVSLEMKQDGMTARIAVENDSVRKQVESNLASLKDSLKDQGIQLQGLEVNVDQRHASLFNPDGSNAESFFRRQGRGDGREHGGFESDPASLETAPESDTGRRWGYNTLEFIG